MLVQWTVANICLPTLSKQEATEIDAAASLKSLDITRTSHKPKPRKNISKTSTSNGHYLLNSVLKIEISVA